MFLGRLPRHYKGALSHSFPRSLPHITLLQSTRCGLPLGSFTPKRTFVEAAVTQTQELITTFHAVTGTPWCLTIALVALGLNFTRLPFTIYARRLEQRRVELVPLIHAWHARISKSTPPSPGKSADRLVNEVEKKVMKKQKEIYRDFGLQVWRAAGGVILTLPLWLGIMESLRRLCGGPVGILGSLFFNKDPASNAAAAIAATTPAPSLLADAFPAVVDPASASSIGTISDAIIPAATTLEQSLATGGLFWFPDLLVADPQHILPWVLSCTIAANLGLIPTSVQKARQLLGGEASQNGEALPQSRRTKLGKGLRRVLVIFSVAIGPMTMGFPAALHVYWICSSGISMLFKHVVQRRMPLPKPITTRCNGEDRVMLLPRPEKDNKRLVDLFK